MDKLITIFGIFAVDFNFRSEKIPITGETLLGKFSTGPGGKGSNQAIAARRAGGNVNFITKIGVDLFGEIALERYKQEGIRTDLIIQDKNYPTGAAAILLENETGKNAIVVCPGAASEFTIDEIMHKESRIQTASFFMTQLETPLTVTFRAMEIAAKHKIPVILNPAPANEIPSSVYPLCDYFIPNEVEASSLAGIPVKDINDAEKAADIFLERGVKNVIITFGEKGVLVKNKDLLEHVPATQLRDPVVDTTGAGDAFSGSFVAALSQGKELPDAIRYANTAAGISVTRLGTALSAPYQHEIEKLLLQAIN
ncbi:MAG: ribokinase [SAR324 cluster bacterium]|nr:ribokinase [SAR324 cluster bacterium]